tara:strand:+ start:448 stop:1815 length:1368 start_codon:yes stop_codon:yes gene_type:complete
MEEQSHTLNRASIRKTRLQLDTNRISGFQQEPTAYQSNGFTRSLEDYNRPFYQEINIDEIESDKKKKDNDNRQRLKKFDLLSVQRKYGIASGTKACLYRLRENETRGVYAREKHSGQVRVLGVTTCDNALCPNCSSKGAREAAENLSLVAREAHLENRSVFALTLTLPHRHMSPEAQVALYAASSTKFWKALRAYFRNIGGIEMEYGQSWDETIRPDYSVHIHKHAEVILSENIELTEARTDDIFGLWKEIVRKESKGKRICRKDGFYCAPVYQDSSDDRYSDYVFKFGIDKASAETMFSQDKGNDTGYSIQQLMSHIYKTSSARGIQIYQSILRAYKGRRYRFISKTIREKADSIRAIAADLVELAAQTEEETPEEWLEIRFVKQGHYAIGFLGLQSAVFRVLEGAQNGDVQAIACLAKLNELNELVYNELDYTFERAICDFGAILQPYRTKSA